jgi:hypothetical protein
MAVETPEDLEGMFHPDDFGERMVAQISARPPAPGEGMVLADGVTVLTGTVFHGIVTTGYVGETPGTTATISMMVPRIIATKAAVGGIQQGDIITRATGEAVSVNDVHYKGELIIIHYHEVW